MDGHLNTLPKKIVSAVSFLIVAVLFFSHAQKVHADETFAHWFKKYFLSAQPKQVITNETYQKPSDKQAVTVPIIVYHSVRPNYPGQTAEVKRYTTEPSVFEQELIYLRDHDYHVISFDDLTAYFETGKPIPQRSVILTFDDGWENQYTYAFPLLKKYGVTGTFFVFTSAIGRSHFLTWDEIREMDAAGMTIGGHTKTHPVLTKITDPKELGAEIAGGKKIIEEHLGKKIYYFAYPFGIRDEASVTAVKAAGYKIGRTSSAGINHTKNDLFELSCLYDQDSVFAFKAFDKVLE